MLGIFVCAYVGILWVFCGGYVTVGFWLVALLWFGGFDCCNTGFWYCVSGVLIFWVVGLGV